MFDFLPVVVVLLLLFVCLSVCLFVCLFVSSSHPLVRFGQLLRYADVDALSINYNESTNRKEQLAR